jgi:hypothetical protein
MDAFTTNPAMEVYFRHSDFFLSGGITTGTLKPTVAGYNATTKKHDSYNIEDMLQYYFKIAFDKMFNDNIRVRPSVSGYFCNDTYSGSLYAGDRTGSRYYLVMNKQSLGTADAYDITKNFTSGNYGPGAFTSNNSIDLNLYTWVHGFEFFGGYEIAKGTNGLEKSKRDYSFDQLHIQALYYFGGKNQFNLGGRYNKVTKAPTKEYLDPDNNTIVLQTKNDKSISVDRMQLIVGWKMTDNILMKLEYVDQKYKDFTSYNAATKTWIYPYGKNAGFKGVMLEAVISF